MAPAPLTDAHEFLGVAGTAQPPNAAFLNSLGDSAPLRVSENHVLAGWLSDLPAQGAGFKRFTYREFYYVFLHHVQFENLDMPLVLRPLWMGRFLRFLTTAGMPLAARSSLHYWIATG